jgi:hypothetical protein
MAMSRAKTRQGDGRIHIARQMTLFDEVIEKPRRLHGLKVGFASEGDGPQYLLVA